MCNTCFEMPVNHSFFSQIDYALLWKPSTSMWAMSMLYKGARGPIRVPKSLSSQKRLQAMLAATGLGESKVQFAEDSWKRVTVYQETLVEKRDLVVECDSRQCNEGKLWILENLERWQQGGISEGQPVCQTCLLPAKIPDRTSSQGHFTSSFQIFRPTNQIKPGCPRRENCLQ